MQKLARQYSIMEVRKLLEYCEGKGPGVGGHAIGTHGELRADVTDRAGHAKDSAFQSEVRIFGKRLVRPGGPSEPTKPVPPMDQAMVVAFALNSKKGQEKLSSLDQKPDNPRNPPGSAIITDMEGLFGKLPQLRIKRNGVATTGTSGKIRVEIFKINGALHIHTAYALA